MARYAIVKDGIVVNIHELVDPTKWQVPEGHTNVPAGDARIGDAFDGASFSTPEPSEREPVKSEFERLVDKLAAKGVLSTGDATELRAKASK